MTTSHLFFLLPTSQTYIYIYTYRHIHCRGYLPLPDDGHHSLYCLSPQNKSSIETPSPRLKMNGLIPPAPGDPSSTSSIDQARNDTKLFFTSQPCRTSRVPNPIPDLPPVFSSCFDEPSELHSRSHVSPAYSDTTYREPLTLEQELKAGEGKRKQTAVTHYEGIPISIIINSDRRGTSSHTHEMDRPPRSTSALVQPQGLPVPKPLGTSVPVVCVNEERRNVITPRRLKRLGTAFQCLSVGPPSPHSCSRSSLSVSTSSTASSESLVCPSSFLPAYGANFSLPWTGR